MIFLVCKISLLARALGQAGATIWNLLYKDIYCLICYYNIFDIVLLPYGLLILLVAWRIKASDYTINIIIVKEIERLNS